MDPEAGERRERAKSKASQHGETGVAQAKIKAVCYLRVFDFNTQTLPEVVAAVSCRFSPQLSLHFVYVCVCVCVCVCARACRPTATQDEADLAFRI